MKKVLSKLLGALLVIFLAALITRIFGHPFWDVWYSYSGPEWLPLEVIGMLISGALLFLSTRSDPYSGWHGIAFVCFCLLGLIGVFYLICMWFQAGSYMEDF